MPKNKTKTVSSLRENAEVLRDILITQLGVAGVPQAKIRDIVGCDIKRVNEIVRYLKPQKQKAR